jgi:hypothetical protein
MGGHLSEYLSGYTKSTQNPQVLGLGLFLGNQVVSLVLYHKSRYPTLEYYDIPHYKRISTIHIRSMLVTFIAIYTNEKSPVILALMILMQRRIYSDDNSYVLLVFPNIL